MIKAFSSALHFALFNTKVTTKDNFIHRHIWVATSMCGIEDQSIKCLFFNYEVAIY